MATGAGVYVRVSTIGQATKGTSLAGQVEVCRRLVSGRGWVMAGEYVDRGVSGAGWSRPGLDRLLDDVGAGVVSVVVVAGLDRLGRSVRHVLSLLGELDDVGVGFVSVAEGFDSTVPEGRLLRGVLGAFAEFEREQIVERGRAGRQAAARAGWWPGGVPPFGWRLARAGGGRRRRLVIDEEEAATIRAAVAGLLVPGTFAETARQLNALGRPTRRGAPWTAAAVRSAVTGSRVGEILDEATRARLPARLGRRTRQGGSRWRYLLSRGRLTSACGAPMAGAGGARIGPSYACTARSSGCGCVRVPAEPLEQAVLAAVVGQLEGVQLNVAASVDPQDLRARIAAIEAALVAEVAAHICRGSPGQVAAEATAALSAELGRLRACLAQAERTRGRHEATVRLARLGPRLLADGQSTPQVAAGLDVRVRILGTVGCPACAGGGKAPGGGGWRCPACRGVRQRPTVRVAGVLPKWRQERNQGDRPFEIDISV